MNFLDDPILEKSHGVLFNIRYDTNHFKILFQKFIVTYFAIFGVLVIRKSFSV